MPFGPDGKLSNNRPNQPNTGNYITPQINAAGLRSAGQAYSAVPVGNVVYLPLALHHIAPWEVLWKFWNALIDRKWYGANRSFLALLGIAKATTSKLEENITKNKFANPGGWDVIICWSEWNLVRGPANRSDDPNTASTLTEKVDFRAFNKNAKAGRLAAMVAVADELIRVIEDPSYPKEEKILVTKIGSWLMLSKQTLLDFDETMWRVAKDSPAYSNVPDPMGGFLVTQPLWRISTKHQGD